MVDNKDMMVQQQQQQQHHPHRSSSSSSPSQHHHLLTSSPSPQPPHPSSLLSSSPSSPHLVPPRLPLKRKSTDSHTPLSPNPTTTPSSNISKPHKQKLLKVILKVPPSPPSSPPSLSPSSHQPTFSSPLPPLSSHPQPPYLHQHPHQRFLIQQQHLQKQRQHQHQHQQQQQHQQQHLLRDQQRHPRDQQHPPRDQPPPQSLPLPSLQLQHHIRQQHQHLHPEPQTQDTNGVFHAQSQPSSQQFKPYAHQPQQQSPQIKPISHQQQKISHLKPHYPHQSPNPPSQLPPSAHSQQIKQAQVLLPQAQQIDLPQNCRITSQQQTNQHVNSEYTRSGQQHQPILPNFSSRASQQEKQEIARNSAHEKPQEQELRDPQLRQQEGEEEENEEEEEEEDEEEEEEDEDEDEEEGEEVEDEEDVEGGLQRRLKRQRQEAKLTPSSSNPRVQELQNKPPPSSPILPKKLPLNPSSGTHGMPQASKVPSPSSRTQPPPSSLSSAPRSSPPSLSATSLSGLSDDAQMPSKKRKLRAVSDALGGPENRRLFATPVSNSQVHQKVDINSTPSLRPRLIQAAKEEDVLPRNFENKEIKDLEGSGVSSKSAAKVQSSQPPPGKKLLKGILDKLQKKDKFGVFAEPVDPKEVPDYYDVIKDPMDFGTMRKRITAGYYSSLTPFEKDITTICSNAMKYNSKGTVYYRQARAIKEATDKIMESLKSFNLASGTAAEIVAKLKLGGPYSKKSHKKKLAVKAWLDRDNGSEPSLVAVGDRNGRMSVAAQNETIGRDTERLFGSGLVSTAFGSAPAELYADGYQDSSGSLFRSIGLGDARRLQVYDENRRNTYKPPTASSHGTSSLVTAISGDPPRFAPTGYQLDFPYARSLARFAADLGPTVWKIASEKIRKALPPGFPFGPGWVGEREGVFVAPLSKPSSLMNANVQPKVLKLPNESRQLLAGDMQAHKFLNECWASNVDVQSCKDGPIKGDSSGTLCAKHSYQPSSVNLNNPPSLEPDTRTSNEDGVQAAEDGQGRMVDPSRGSHNTGHIVGSSTTAPVDPVPMARDAQMSRLIPSKPAQVGTIPSMPASAVLTSQNAGRLQTGSRLSNENEMFTSVTNTQTDRGFGLKGNGSGEAKNESLNRAKFAVLSDSRGSAPNLNMMPSSMSHNLNVSIGSKAPPNLNVPSSAVAPPNLNAPAGPLPPNSRLPAPNLNMPSNPMPPPNPNTPSNSIPPPNLNVPSNSTMQATANHTAPLLNEGQPHMSAPIFNLDLAGKLKTTMVMQERGSAGWGHVSQGEGGLQISSALPERYTIDHHKERTEGNEAENLTPVARVSSGIVSGKQPTFGAGGQSIRQSSVLNHDDYVIDSNPRSVSTLNHMASRQQNTNAGSLSVSSATPASNSILSGQEDANLHGWVQAQRVEGANGRTAGMKMQTQGLGNTLQKSQVDVVHYSDFQDKHARLLSQQPHLLSRFGNQRLTTLPQFLQQQMNPEMHLAVQQQQVRLPSSGSANSVSSSQGGVDSRDPKLLRHLQLPGHLVSSGGPQLQSQAWQYVGPPTIALQGSNVSLSAAPDLNVSLPSARSHPDQSNGCEMQQPDLALQL